MVSERTLQRKVVRFEAEGMESLFGSEHARRKRLPDSMRRLIVDLKAEYPGFNPNEIANACYVRFGRRPARKTVERRRAVVALHAEGWSAKAISGYLRMHRSTVHRVLRRWVEEGVEGLEDRPHERPPGVRKVDLKAIDAVRRLQQNPNLGAFKVHAALAQIGVHLSPRTCGRILDTNRALMAWTSPRGR